MPRQLWKGAIQFGLVHVPVSPLTGDRWPTLAQADRRPAVREPELVRVAPPSKK